MFKNLGSHFTGTWRTLFLAISYSAIPQVKWRTHYYWRHLVASTLSQYNWDYHVYNSWVNLLSTVRQPRLIGEANHSGFKMGEFLALLCEDKNLSHHLGAHLHRLLSSREGLEARIYDQIPREQKTGCSFLPPIFPCLTAEHLSRADMPPLVYNPKSYNTENDQEGKILEMDIFLWGKSKLQGQTHFHWTPTLGLPALFHIFVHPSLKHVLQLTRKDLQCTMRLRVTATGASNWRINSGGFLGAKIWRNFGDWKWWDWKLELPASWEM